MTGYYLQLAWLNLRRSPWLTALIVLAVGVGIGSSMTVYSLLHAMARDPIPHKSSQLYAPRLDTQGPRHQASMMGVRGIRSGEPADLMTYRDAVALRDAGLGQRQAVMYQASYIVATEDRTHGSLPARATDADFFLMFDLSFLAGSAWRREEDAAGARVVVLSERLARLLFGLADARQALHRTLTLNGNTFVVAGVTQAWSPQPRFYDLGFSSTAMAYGSGDELFLPLNAATAMMGDTGGMGSNACGREIEIAGTPPRTRERWLTGECLWTQLWVELPGAAEVQRFDAFLRGYAAEQQRSGRVDWLPETRLHNVRRWLVAYEVVPDEYRLATILALAFLAVCLVNATGIMLAQLRRRSAELGLRRALGASRGVLFAQCLTEAALLGLLGAALGLALAGLGIMAQRRLLAPELAPLARLDAMVLTVAIGAALLGTVLAALYPAWRVSHERSAAGRNPRALRAGAGRTLTALQITATMALVANCLFVAWQKLEQIGRPIDVDAPQLFTVFSAWDREYEDLQARIEGDLAELRAVPGVEQVSVALTPLQAHGSGLEVSSRPQGTAPTVAHFHRVDERTLETWGTRPLAGRWFQREEVGRGSPSAPLAVVTRAVAEREFGDAEQAVGKTLVFRNYRGGMQVTVIGVVGHLPGMPWLGDEDHVVFYPIVHAPGGAVAYVVRAAAGALDITMPEAVRRLRDSDPARAIGNPTLEAALGHAGEAGAIPFIEFRDLVYRADRGLASMLFATAVLLLMVAALGIVGVTSNWVSQRRHQIGVRRALGARRRDILHRFQSENLAIVVIGVLAGGVLALAANLWLVQQFEMSRIDPLVLLPAAALIVLLSQLAAFWSALRAARVPPALTTRIT